MVAKQNGNMLAFLVDGIGCDSVGLDGGAVKAEVVLATIISVADEPECSVTLVMRFIRIVRPINAVMKDCADRNSGIIG